MEIPLLVSMFAHGALQAGDCSPLQSGATTKPSRNFFLGLFILRLLDGVKEWLLGKLDFFDASAVFSSDVSFLVLF